MLQRLAALAHATAHQQHQQLQHVLLPLLQLPQQVQQQQQQLAAQQRICTASYSTSSTLSSSLRSVMSRGGHLAACSSTGWFPAPQPLHPASLPSLWHTTQQLAAYSQRLSKMNPKERKAQQVKDKKTLKKSAVPQGTASAGDSATSFEDDMQTVEADVTRLVLQVRGAHAGAHVKRGCATSSSLVRSRLCTSGQAAATALAPQGLCVRCV